MNHRADGRARIAGPPRPWWRTAIDHPRPVLLAIVVFIGYTSLGVQELERGRSMIGLGCFALAATTLAALAGWLRPAHRYRHAAIAVLLILVVGFLAGLWALT